MLLPVLVLLPVQLPLPVLVVLLLLVLLPVLVLLLVQPPVACWQRGCGGHCEGLLLQSLTGGGTGQSLS